MLGGSAMHAYIAFSSSRRPGTPKVCALSVAVTTELERGDEVSGVEPELASYLRIE
jgi:hypothetical protein